MIRKVMYGLLTAAALVPGAAQAAWQKAESKHFVVYSDDNSDEVKRYTQRLERFDSAVRMLMGLKDPEVAPDARVVVFVLPSVDAVQKMHGGHNNVAGYYNGYYPSGAFAFMPRREAGDNGGQTANTVLFHEYTHHIFASNFGGTLFPLWFNEGFAELFATVRFRDDGGLIFGAEPTYREYGINQFNVVPAEKLVTSTSYSQDAMVNQVFYGRAWLLSHYLLFNGERAKQLVAYITAVNEGESPAETAKILGAGSSLDFKLNAYGKQATKPAIPVAADRVPIGAVTVTALSPGEASVMPARMRSHNGVDAKSALEVVQLARTEAAAFPNDPAAQNELAEAEYDACDSNTKSDAACFNATEAAADRALATDPTSVHGMIYKGMALMAKADKAKNSDPAVWTAARRWFLAANKAEPLYSYPVELYYESFGTAKQKPTKGAEDGALYGYVLAPRVFALRWEAAHILLGRGEVKAARVALEPVAFSEERGPLADRAKKALGMLDSGDTAGALKALDEKPDTSKAADKKPS